ncbi:MAG TPA: uroporphyrinogen decarboxylase family protein [Opitutaceae bacterium]|nr:uroporphyrinogen decarboxylase family protein [Opitutaceae bacterium]HND61686.1 uroporphyrinogen decarboxylase family protein [Opitutaceae bacterium]
MTSKQRFLTALAGGKPDRLPVTTHWVPGYFLQNVVHLAEQDFYDRFGLDPILYLAPHLPNLAKGEYFDPDQGEIGFLESRRVASDQWRVRREDLPGRKYPATRWSFVTPKGTLSMVLESDRYSAWVVEHLIKEKRDIDLIGEFCTAPLCDVTTVNRAAETYGERGLVRSYVCCFDVFGQPGTWQDATCLAGTEEMIMATFDDPSWVHQFLTILQRRKKIYLDSMVGAKFDLLELGGGSASSSVISPAIFDEFVAPYDGELIALAHHREQRIAYHTCGGMMAFLERIAAMRPNAMETFTPAAMGGDARLAEARRRIPRDICMIGGFDQYHHFVGCTPAITRQEVRRCFEEAGRDGGYILCPSDQFFEADAPLLEAFADEARRCTY